MRTEEEQREGRSFVFICKHKGHCSELMYSTLMWTNENGNAVCEVDDNDIVR